MERTVHNIILDLKKDNYAQVKVNQNEANSRELVIQIMDDAEPVSVEDSIEAVIRYTKPDGKGVEVEGSVENGKIHIIFSQGMLSVAGKMPANITLIHEGQILSTMRFQLLIERAPLQDGTVRSSDEYSALDKHHVELQEELRKTEDLVQDAKESATQASGSADSASKSAGTATTKAKEASTYAENAKASATQASGSAENASDSAEVALAKAAEAIKAAQEALEYARGENDSAEYYYNQAKSISESFSGALRPIGTISYAELPDISTAVEGDMYNISDEFTTSDAFKEGAGNTVPAGSNIYKTIDGMWDILAGTPVTGIKGNKETKYRRGNVNLTPAQIGAVAIGGNVATNYVAFTSQDSEDEVDASLPEVMNTKETTASLFSKVSQVIKNVRWIVKTIGKTDISSVGDGTLKGAVKSLNIKMELVRSHVGMIVQSTTLDTEAKVIAIYGGTSWSKVEGRFLLGTSSSYAVNSIGGETAHTLTTAEMPSHNHASSTRRGAIPCWDNKASSTGKYYGLYDGSLAYQSSYAYDISTTSTSLAGGNAAHNNMPPYKVVYIWERTA